MNVPIRPAPDPNPLREQALALVGVRLTGWEKGRAEFTLAVEARHLNFNGGLHGGLVGMLLDVACGYAAMPELTGGVATLSLAINYLAGAPAGAVRATGRVTGGGRRIVFASAELADVSGRVLATAQGSFRVAPPGR